MKQNFNNDIISPEKFVVTLELVPGRESSGRTIDTIRRISKDAMKDGRITAVSITDNPGGNPALSPDALGREILEEGMDVIVHFTCRDTNRVGMESRALQLAHIGMKNILALTGDYSGNKGFGGRGTPVFDFDSVILTSMLTELGAKIQETDPSGRFNIGCAISPFKYSEAEAWIQYKKLELKIKAGASFAITQLGYDIDKYEELIRYAKENNLQIPILASLYFLTAKSARLMNAGNVPGVIVTEKLLRLVTEEWEDPSEGRKRAIERSARLGAVLKGVGYKGIHLGGIHDSFDTVGKILDRMSVIEHNWQDYVGEFQEDKSNRFYLYPKTAPLQPQVPSREKIKVNFTEDCHYLFLRATHDLFFNKDAPFSSICKKISSTLDKSNTSWLLKVLLEDPFKKLMLSCQSCGDCGIQHVGFLCPESGCPKHTRNGACGGSKDGFCEVNTDRLCVWVRAYRRMQKHGEADKLTCEIIPPRPWDLENTSSWINFHLNRDHQKTLD